MAFLYQFMYGATESLPAFDVEANGNGAPNTASACTCLVSSLGVDVDVTTGNGDVMGMD